MGVINNGGFSVLVPILLVRNRGLKKNGERANMSYINMHETGQRVEFFGSSKGEEMAKVTGAPLNAQFPMDPDLARLCNEGEIEH